MNEFPEPIPPSTGPLRQVHNRFAEDTAPLRCLCYAAFSELTASPHDMDPRPALKQRIGLGEAVPYAAVLDGLLVEVANCELDSLRLQYSGLFEVGSQGPPVPIREDLQTGQRAGTREDVVRFYDYFGYTLGEKFAWQPDHLSVELEFMHYLCYREARSGADALSFQLAQLDFTERHLARWVPGFAAAVDQLAPHSLYGRVIAGLRDFVAGDFEWQVNTVTAGEART
jgi:DMSO reductase family type II enzyme chaperone